MLFTIEQVEKDFKDFEIEQLGERELPIHEGKFHNGIGSIIRFVGRKKPF